MSKRVDLPILLDIAIACRRVAAFIEGMDEASFRSDIKTQSAVQHQVLIIGEATKRLSAEFRETHPSAPWNSIARMRDRLIHGYDTVDLSIVWNTATTGVVELRKIIEPSLDAPDCG